MGVEKFEDLVQSIPEEIRLDHGLPLPEGLSELEVTQRLSEIGSKNHKAVDSINFLGGGVYDHFIPAGVNAITSRSEFYTAYTPYQPEVSQGTLQSIYEYQSAICDITGMDISNASVYDGPTAVTEAMLLALRASKKRTQVIVSDGLHPHALKIMRTYAEADGFELHTIEIGEDGRTNMEMLKRILGNNTAAVIFQQPNFLGVLEDAKKIVDMGHKVGALAISSVYPVSLGMVQPPGEYDADIAVGEGQCLGNPIGFGGPYLGILAVKQALIRQLPGRLSGQTVDKDGLRGYVLTLQTREQHIRRGKATSNICTNQGLNALAALVHMSLLGKQGFKEVAQLCYDKAHYLYDQIIENTRFRPTFSTPFFNEFVLTTPILAVDVVDRMIDKDILAGIRLDRFFPDREKQLLVAVTEKRTKEELDQFVKALATIG
ncbi:MAG TPA: aminomethyl-transferring glycine dehydrogenase subunit GcvPA [Bacteroidetes bacterium]|nr:aminomethyl-transferring glycine dehydrogenase subunit GcvPA [Bacteroidota bacterium]HEX04381.1 aminomethyl-transferring glycine dehydrogenase subunit GcvPA [Bacteroidota bacterium]